MPLMRSETPAVVDVFQPAVRLWFQEAFPAPTPAQTKAWPSIAAGANTLLLAPTGSGKTLAAFLVAIDRLMFPKSEAPSGVRVLYISPLKALGVDVERNLRSPIAGVRAVAEREGLAHHVPSVGIRSGDTPSAERVRMTRDPPEILITTPESLFLLLTSRAREILASVDTVIVDEIHALAGTKRGAHLFLSLERLERLRPGMGPLQRIGLSATQRPLEEIARLLGGGEASADLEVSPTPRRVEIIEAGRRRPFDLTIEVPVEDMARLAEPQQQSGPAASGPTVASIWPSIHPRLVELIRQHRTTLLFANSRRLAERLSAAINTVAGEEIVLAHHGSIARDQRADIEDRLKRGVLPAIVATSSLELGIDMGSVDLVIQIEAPPSVASGMQRIGRAGHRIDARSKGVIFPKYRGDLLACSTAVERMQRGEVEETFYPRNPLDVLAQQIVAMAALEPVKVDDVFQTVRSSAPFFELPRSAFESVLDLLSGRYPSDEFSELRPRINWDRLDGLLSPRKGTQRIAIANAGTIPDRGLYGVFLIGSDGTGSRVGELDEEMVFEMRPGDVFLLGASSWRVQEITHDRVIVVPAPGEPGRMPFWRGDGLSRPAEFGRAIGALTRRLMRMGREKAHAVLTSEHGLDERAANNLLAYLHDQAEATGECPSDQTLIVECFLDEVGDWRVVILSPFGARLHAPWAMAVGARLRQETGGEVDIVWSDDGLVFRLAGSDGLPSLDLLFPKPEEIEDLVLRELGSTALFAARFRENAARSLLLPRRQPGQRTPLWLQRKKSADLLSVAARYERFPVMLETYRECLRDVFDLPGLKSLLQDVERRTIRVRTVETSKPSPFAASLLFAYTANFLYNGDAPLAERRAQTLALNHAQLRELLGDAELRELLDASVVEDLALELQRLDGQYPLRDADAVHDLLVRLGDLTREELAARSGGVSGRALAPGSGGAQPQQRNQTDAEVAGFAREEPGASARPLTTSGDLNRWVSDLLAHKRVLEVSIAGEPRLIASEDAARYRDALGIVSPPGLPAAFLETVADPLGDLVSRYARTHVPFRPEDSARRFGLGIAPVKEALLRLAAQERVLEGEFLPNGRGREWCSSEVLRTLKRRSLARLRKQVEPVDPQALGRFLVEWQGLARPRRGLDGLLDVVEQLQGLPLPMSDLEREILPARIERYRPSDLDELCAAGEVVWRGFESLGPRDGRVAVYLADQLVKLAPILLETGATGSASASERRQSTGEASGTHQSTDPLEQQIVEALATRGAMFFDELLRLIGGFPNDLLDALWRLVWAGQITNDTLAPLRSLLGPPRDRKERAVRRAFRSRRTGRTPGSEGRWTLLLRPGIERPTPTECQTALALQLIERYGVVTREWVASENIPGGFTGLYPVYKAMEESGRVRRGYFVAGQGAAQFAAPGADDRLRERPRDEDEPPIYVLAATDPANPYGAALRWPATSSSADSPALRPQRAANARVILCDGLLLGTLSRTGRHLLTFLPEAEPDRTHLQAALIRGLVSMAKPGDPVFLARIDGEPIAESPLEAALREAGFKAHSKGYVHRGTA